MPNIEEYLSDVVSPAIVINREGHILNEKEQEEEGPYKPLQAGVSCIYRGQTMIISWDQPPSQRCKTRLISWLRTEPHFEYRIMPPAQVDTKTFTAYEPMLRYLTRIMRTR